MKAVLVIIRWFVGILFIFSGLVKANDPHGLSYKMQEFFEAWNLHAFHDYTLVFAILMNAFEIIAGVAVIIGWQMRLFSWLLVLLIVFFTFLTGYASLATNADGTMKFHSCGCFGDCLPLDPFQSFLKDLLLLLLTGIIFYYRKTIRPLFSKAAFNITAVLLSVFVSFAFQWYVWKYLPVVDCLPYKKGNRIAALSKMPANAIPDKFDIRFVYQKNGEEQEFNMSNLPDSTWQFKERKQVLIEKGKNNEPLIKDFILTNEAGADVTDDVLHQPDVYYILFVLHTNALSANKRWMEKLADFSSRHKIFIVTSVPDAAKAYFSSHHSLGQLPVLSCDGTAIKTAARVIPTLYKMKEDLILEKWSGASYKKWE